METIPGQSPATTEETTAEAAASEAAFTEAMKGGDWPADTPADAPPPAEVHPTRAEAREMFKDNPGLWSVFTDEGTMTRDEC